MILDHVESRIFHGRRGAIENAFRYSADYILLEPEARGKTPALFSRDRGNLTSLHDRDHGGARHGKSASAWVRQVVATHGLDFDGRVLLLTQPRVLGHVFNPVSFWLVHDRDDVLRAVIAEVSNTFGDRHFYLCVKPDHGPIVGADILTARKIFHVSPFQSLEGEYAFRFDITDLRIDIRIDYRAGRNGLIATLTGSRTRLSDAAILRFCLRRPFGSRRVLGLIYWQALKLWWKGAAYRARPEPPADEISR
ncbi:MAG: DUF1365 domain-containing protein [Pseudomonadota bacterium]